MTAAYGTGRTTTRQYGSGSKQDAIAENAARMTSVWNFSHERMGYRWQTALDHGHQF